MDAQREPAVAVEPLPQPPPAVALVVVDGHHAARVRRGHRRAERLRLLERGARREREVPGLALAHDPVARLPRRAQGRRVDPQRVVVVRPERDRPLAGDAVEDLRCRPSVGPGLLEPAVAAQPPVTLRRGLARDPQRLGHRPGPAELELGPAQGPVEEVDVGVAEAGQDAPPLQVDPLVPDGVGGALAHVDSAGDRVGRDRERAHLGQAGIHGVDGPVVQDHGSTNLRDRDAEGRDRPQAGGAQIRARRRRPRRRADRPAHRPRLLLGDEPAGAPRRAGRAARPCCSCAACSSGPGPSRRSIGSSRCARSAPSRAALAAAGVESGATDRPRARRPAGAGSTSATPAGCPSMSSATARRPCGGVRARKSDWELARMRAACEQVRRGAEAVPGLLRPGIVESDGSTRG